MDKLYSILKQIWALLGFVLSYLNPFSTMEEDVIIPKEDEELTDEEAEKFSGE